MARLVWDQIGQKLYETGTDRGVLYPTGDDGNYTDGAAWNGLIGVTQSPSGAEETKLYANNAKYLGLRSAEDFNATITSYTYPDEFAACNGEVEAAPGVTLGQQTRKPFGMTYRTLIGNDVKNEDYGYKIHLIYGATASPSERAYKTTNEDQEAIEFSHEISTTPVAVEGYKPASHMEIDSTKTTAEKLKALEDILYGTEEGTARLPLPNEVIELMTNA